LTYNRQGERLKNQFVSLKTYLSALTKSGKYIRF